ncbi:MAG: hypothetical protein L0G70_11650 [Rubrobacter sp.]|nr:hypothetical protein [Rubrobacter sp.]
MIAHGKLATDAISDLINYTGRIHTGDVRRWILTLTLDTRAVTHEYVSRIYGGCMYSEANLPETGMRLRELYSLKRFRTAVFGNAYSFHVSSMHSRSPWSNLVTELR